MWSGGGDTLCHNHPVWPDGWLARRCFVPENKLLTTLLIFWSTPSGIYKKVIQTLSVPFLTFLMWPWLLKIPSEDFADVMVMVMEMIDDVRGGDRHGGWQGGRRGDRHGGFQSGRHGGEDTSFECGDLDNPQIGPIYFSMAAPFSTLAHTHYETSFTE